MMEFTSSPLSWINVTSGKVGVAAVQLSTQVYLCPTELTIF
jgi:hypothetical protein